ncbi:NAD(P)-binding protein [Punctularia strigosozonata HHB-11173 SS5]|uniref:NAD(P)-binding protein n=1 Tax=Punctularia strigosozonata (strain HHB-11173) TaxID=741275 RepID=UPI00044177F9|nr:NAD(P)-binding protein [Punctularia strigosozonata HHB-11173 SS5]EIN12897.1 NAD(P)-binding protein [Punctularia strigosozonata HHB-11173 SS5]
MTTILDDQLLTYGDRCMGKVVLITGAASGIGRAAATQFAKLGAKIVIGDIDLAGAQETASRIKSAGGQAVVKGCDVSSWEDQTALFELAISTYGAVDIVIPNAGVIEMGQYFVTSMSSGPDPRPLKPNLKTLEINLIAVLYTVNLAQHYLKINRAPLEGLKAIVLIASIASWIALFEGPIYSASKHGVLGLMRALAPLYAKDNIRISSIHPWFADTNILNTQLKVILAGIPMTPVERIANAIVYSATDPSPLTNGCPWLLPDDGPLLLLEQEVLREGVYDMLNKRVARVKSITESLYLCTAFGAAVGRLLFRPVMLSAGLAGMAYAWHRYGRLLQ